MSLVIADIKIKTALLFVLQFFYLYGLLKGCIIKNKSVSF